MKIRKKVASVLAGVLMLSGLAVIAETVVAPAAQAHPLPATGQHTLEYKCDEGLYHATLKFTYTMTQGAALGPLTPGAYYYTFTLLTATYTATPGQANPPRGPQITITSNLGPGYSQDFPLNAAFGGADNNNKYPFGWASGGAPHHPAVAPLTTNVAATGSNGLPWNSVQIVSNPNATNVQTGRVYWWGLSGSAGSRPTCGMVSNVEKYKWDLSNPDRPIDGVDTTNVLYCNNANGTDSVTAQYDIAHLSGDLYSFQIQDMDLTSVEGFSGILTMVLEDSNGDLIDIGPTSPVPGLILLPPGAISYENVANDNPPQVFPQVTFNYHIGGLTPNVSFTFQRDTPQELDCTVKWDLADTWNTAEDQYYNTEIVPFNTCTADPQPAGQLLITSFWDLNSNGNHVRSNHVVIVNSSPVTIKLHTGTGVQNPKLQSGIVGMDDLVFMKTNATTTDRNWTTGQTKSLNTTNAGIWGPIASGLPSTAPAELKTLSPPNILAYSMDWDVFSTPTFICPSGTAMLEDVVATSDF